MSGFAMVAGFASLALVLWIQRRSGPRVAGLCACLPLTSGPLALAVYLARGSDAALAVVAGSVDAIGGAAVALTAFCALRRAALWLSVPITALAFMATITTKNLLSTTPTQSVLTSALLVMLCISISKCFVRERAAPAAQAVTQKWTTTWPMPFAMLGLCFVLASALPPALSGLLASAPILALTVLIPMRVGNATGNGIVHAVQGSYAGVGAKLVFFVVAMAALDFERHAALAFAVGALACFVVGFVLWPRNRHTATRSAAPAIVIPSGLASRTRAA